MKIYLKMAILLVLINTSFLNAYNFEQFKPISWDWIIIIFLIILFFILLISIIRDIKSNKKRIKTILIQEKCKKIDQNRYLYDINNNTLKNSNEIGKTLKILMMHNDDEKIIEKLKQNYENIFLNSQEENIFLSIASNKDIGRITIFELQDIINELKNYGLLKNSKVEIEKDSVYPIVSNKEILQSIVFLLSKIQLKEHSLKKANISIEILEHENIINIEIPESLPLNSELLNIINNGIQPKYYNPKKKYYGVYLYLINKLAKRLNGELFINIQENQFYNVTAKIPIELVKKPVDVDLQISKKLKTPKNALIVANNIEISNKIAAYLQQFNFNVDIEFGKELNKEIPNFLNYDIVLMEAELFEPILSDYIISVKKYSDLKVVTIEQNSKIYNYPKNLIDNKVDTKAIDKEINNLILTTYSQELVDITDKMKANISNLESTKEPKNKRSKVLIADDDRTNLHILEYLIKQYGIEVYTAQNGIEALEILKTVNCDLIILDSIMPKLNGYETIKKLRKNPKYNSTPVVIHTSFSLNNSIEDIFKLGFDSYLAKPFNKYELEALLERYLPIESHIEPNLEQNIEENILSSNEDDLEEFLAIYSDSDRLIERYIKENRQEQTISVLSDLKKASKKIGAYKFIKSINTIEEEIKQNKKIDNNTVYALSKNLKELKTSIIERLNNH